MKKPGGGDLRALQVCCSTSDLTLVGPTGVEVPPQTYCKTSLSETGGTETGTLAAQLALADADLRMVIDAWAGLSEATKLGILAMVRATKDTSK